MFIYSIEGASIALIVIAFTVMKAHFFFKARKPRERESWPQD